MAQSNLFEQMRIRGFVDGWQKFTIEKWQKQLRKQGIGVTDTLINSFEKDVASRGGEIIESNLKFLLYGRFRDMNVGRGLKAYERTSNTLARNSQRRYGVQSRVVARTQKRWINKINAAQTYRLSEILGTRASEAIISDFNTTNNITVNING
ncbi:hypothetical protein OQZ33_04475 [Pedobacter sp. MC2016-05]|uniref:hypothetical protein n=1 Tax=Pedobacter sp. MC2016-05 TaxID=2994474 RepID=UPI002247ADC3|nr:hypothetical protein [Pedobacter sp. MC2016-05]MCX2473582.1 hypothetical protein [Pedobacter sp. MC2016-05]